MCVFIGSRCRQENVYSMRWLTNVSWETYDAIFSFLDIPLPSRWTLVCSADDAVEQAPPLSRLKKTKREAKGVVLVLAATEEKKKSGTHFCCCCLVVRLVSDKVRTTKSLDFSVANGWALFLISFFFSLPARLTHSLTSHLCSVWA